MNNEIIVVTAAYGNDKVAQLGGQLALLEMIKSSGADGVEIRQELLSPNDNLEKIALKIKQLALISVYSVPCTLFDNSGAIDLDLVQNSLFDSKLLGARYLKLSLGHLPALYDLSPLLPLLHNSSVQLVIENDQTAEGGHIAPLIRFFESVKLNALPIKMTFDMANWHWHGEDALIAAQTFSSFVAYIHVKESEIKANKRVAIALDDSDGSWKKVLSCLPNNVPRGIEFPLIGQDLTAVTNHYISQLKDI
nr:xylose isomerase [uncultured Moellerella sp.]